MAGRVSMRVPISRTMRTVAVDGHKASHSRDCEGWQRADGAFQAGPVDGATSSSLLLTGLRRPSMATVLGQGLVAHYDDPDVLRDSQRPRATGRCAWQTPAPSRVVDQRSYIQQAAPDRAPGVASRRWF